MRLLVLSFYYEPDLSAGSFRTTQLVQALKGAANHDIEIDVITTMPNRYHSFKQAARPFEISDNVTTRRIQLSHHQSGMRDQSLAFSRYLIGVLRHTRGKYYDLIYATSSRLLTAALGALVSKMIKAPLYLDIRDIFTDTITDLVHNPLMRILKPSLLSLEQFTITSARHVNLVSEGFKPYFEAIVPHQSFSFYTNGIDEDFIKNDFNIKNSSEKKTLLYAGNIGKGQGLDRIIPDLANEIGKQWHIKVIGDGGARKLLETSLQEKRAENVTLLEPMPRSALVHQYAQSDCLFLHLNRHRAFEKVLPSKIFEYAATGKPILAGVSGYAKQFIEQHVVNAAVFPPCNVNDGVKKLSTLKIGHTERNGFIDQYRRSTLSNRMAKDILSLAKEKI